MHPWKTVVLARTMAATGVSGNEISRQLDVSRRSVGRWLRGETRRVERTAPTAPTADDLVRAHNASSYAYLLGLYLGDGHLSDMRRGVYRLRITLDASYPAVAQSAAAAARAVLPTNRVRISELKCAAVSVESYSKAWPILLPQHGAGRKHTRDITLLAWQDWVVHRHTREFVRGLIHSDGCRFIAQQRRRGRVYAYPRYCFKNRSADILELFCRALDRLGIAWTASGADQIQIAQRESVQAMDRFVGPKR